MEKGAFRADAASQHQRLLDAEFIHAAEKFIFVNRRFVFHDPAAEMGADAAGLARRRVEKNP